MSHPSLLKPLGCIPRWNAGVFVSDGAAPKIRGRGNDVELSATMIVREPFVIRGQSGFLAIPIVGIPALTLAAFTYYREHLPDFCLDNAGKVIGLSALVTVGLLLVAAFLRSRRVEVDDDSIRYHSWLTDLTLPAVAISAVTFETEVSEGSDGASVSRYLTLWSGDEIALKLNSVFWPPAGMAGLLDRLRESAPGLRMDLSVERFMGVKGV